MKPEEILHQAVKKAFGSCLEEYAKFQIERDGGYTLIFSHNFAKKFWGEDKYFCAVEGEWNNDFISKEEADILLSQDNYWQTVMPIWQRHLQLMVLEKDPLKYLEQFLEVS